MKCRRTKKTHKFVCVLFLEDYPNKKGTYEPDNVLKSGCSCGWIWESGDYDWGNWWYPWHDGDGEITPGIAKMAEAYWIKYHKNFMG